MAVSGEVARYRSLFGEEVSQDVAEAYFARVDQHLDDQLKKGWEEIGKELIKPENEEAFARLVDNCAKKKKA